MFITAALEEMESNRKGRRIHERPLRMFLCVYPGLQPTARNSMCPEGLDSNAAKTSSKESTNCFRRSKVNTRQDKAIANGEGEKKRSF